MDEHQNGGPSPTMQGLTYLIATASILWQKATHDGTLAAAGRQGIDELGAALKAFPDAIQVQEYGTIFEPTQGEIAAGRRESVFGRGHYSPSAIVASHSGVHGPARDLAPEASPARAPSEIVASHSGVYGPEGGHQAEAGPVSSPSQNVADNGPETSFVEREMERERNRNNNGGADQSELARGRVLPDEQLENNKGRGR